MTTPQLIQWFDEKMTKFGGGKLIPPPPVLEQELADRIESKLRELITQLILREAKVDDQVAAAIAQLQTPDGDKLVQDVEQLFEHESDREWRDAIEALATSITRHIS